MKRICRVCVIEKELEEFKRHAQCVDGRTHVCVECSRAKGRAHYVDNRVEILEALRSGSNAQDPGDTRPLSCNACRLVKPATEFAITGSKRGRSYRCNECARARSAVHYSKSENRLKRNESSRRWYYERRVDPGYLEGVAVKHRIKNAKIRELVIAHLGGACARCGLDDIRALQIDHVHGGGKQDLSSKSYSQHIREVLSSTPGVIYQCLCASCNWIKRAEAGETAQKYAI